MLTSDKLEAIRKEVNNELATLRGGDGRSHRFAGLCLELLEHVAEQGAQVSRLQTQLQSASYREVLNLRARIARLTPLEFLLAKGGNPMTQMVEAIRELSDQLEAQAAERVIADGAKGPTPDYTGEGSAWIPPKTKPHTFAQMVKVPDITDEQLRDLIVNAARRCGFVDYDPEDVSTGDLEILREARDGLAELLRAIPADRVLGDGMVQVSKEELEWLKRLYSWMSAADEGGVKVSFSLTEFPEGVACLEGIATSLAALDALRANQGGADNG